ncbi:YraN family protein [candidate division WWE3 bacterium]|uniref:UPF0102 protein GYA27_00490 n=1 Tax=candidate division WWE3 bacterium TaxID=2053526 RepID=A0A7X9HGJ8_UNCKA|nr:YraN family protein [candidate division WWE3 bacterium]
MFSREIGNIGENIAIAYLKTKKFYILAKNVYVRWGEIDIIAIKNRKIYFFEVKYSRTGIPAVDMYSKSKRRKVIRSVYLWLDLYSKMKNYSPKLGLIAIQRLSDGLDIKVYIEALY